VHPCAVPLRHPPRGLIPIPSFQQGVSKWVGKHWERRHPPAGASAARKEKVHLVIWRQACLPFRGGRTTPHLASRGFLLRVGMSGGRVWGAEVDREEFSGYEGGTALRSLYGEGPEGGYRVKGGVIRRLRSAMEIDEVSKGESRGRSWLSRGRDAMHQMRRGDRCFYSGHGDEYGLERWGNISLALAELRLRAEGYIISRRTVRLPYRPPRGEAGVYFYLRAGEQGPAGKKCAS
jgi:hypothetical protein